MLEPFDRYRIHIGVPGMGKPIRLSTDDAAGARVIMGILAAHPTLELTARLEDCKIASVHDRPRIMAEFGNGPDRGLLPPVK